MDSLAHLALMTKSQLVFGAPGTFLSFPALSPFSYPPDQLSFANSSTLTAEQQRSWAEFCQVTNSLPTGTIFRPPHDTYLWDKYREVLKTAIRATGELSPEQQAALAAAQAYLRVTTADGSQTDTPALLAYRQYRDAWFKAVQDYNTQEVTAHASTDAKQQAQWTGTDEPALRARVVAAEANWESNGNKAAVERAQQVEATVGAQSPQLIWDDWASQLIPDIDLPTDPIMGPFGRTQFVPSNAVEEKDWSSSTLTALEIGRLVGQAPKELAAIFGDLPNSSEIDSISFEYRSVGLRRPWFQPEVFNARFWKLPDASRQLSDGGDPPQGEWPAYITAVVFVRSIVLQIRTASAAPVPVQLPALPSIAATAPIAAPGTAPAVAPPASPPIGVWMGDTMMWMPATLPPPSPAPDYITTAFELAGPWAAGGGPGPKISRSENALTVDMSAYGRPPTYGSVIDAQTVTVNFSDDAIFTGRLLPPVTIAWSNGTSWTKVPVPALPPEPKPEVITDVSILCFICKRLPKCPDPDPALRW